MNKPGQIDSFEAHATARRLARSCTGLKRMVQRSRGELDPHVFDYPALRNVTGEITRLVDSIDKFCEHVDAEADVMRGGVRGSRPRPTRTSVLDVAGIFDEVANAEAPAAPDAAEDCDCPTDGIVRFPPGMFRLTDILQLLAAHQKTGSIRVECPNEVIDIHLQDGDITAAHSVDGPERTRLGEVLVERGVITRDQLKIILAASQKSERKIGALLREWVNISEADVAAALHDQIKVLFQRALSSPDACIVFRPATSVTENEYDTARLNVMSILLESIADAEGPDRG
ncbi:MAG: DUF4388 domain-containing protein [Planctomycetota bacterium]